jgi:hypothetical protein
LVKRQTPGRQKILITLKLKAIKMKTLLFMVLLLPLVSLGQQRGKVTLELSTGDCRTNKHVRVGFSDTIRFYRNGQFYKRIIPTRYNQWPIKVEDFNSGTYKVTFRNLYGKMTTKTVIIPDTSDYALALCPDELESYPRNSLAALQNGETIKINFSSQGCFHSDQEVLVLTKLSNGISARLFYNGKTKTITLSKSQLEAFRRFENELMVIENDGGCTTTDSYVFATNTTTLKKVDGGCDWRGFSVLRYTLFGKVD